MLMCDNNGADKEEKSQTVDSLDPQGWFMLHFFVVQLIQYSRVWISNIHFLSTNVIHDSQFCFSFYYFWNMKL